MDKILAIIPARGGSKGLPGKNTKKINGKPLIEYTIEAAIASKLINRIIVSTDDQEIAEVAIKAGAEVPYLRPEYLARDDSKVIDTCLYVLAKLKEEDYIPDAVILLQPTSPLRTSIHIKEAVEVFLEKKADSVISVCDSNYSPSLLTKIDSNGILIPVLDSYDIFNNRQALEKVYKLNGAIYIIKTSLLIKNKSFFGKRTYPYIMPVEASIDIDTYFDFNLAAMLQKKNGGMVD